ncbi:PEP-CTERM sorting domain-containing protein [Verrucomicrobiaceae bacterium 5K15]|uniref:PEP-CTERM sorting domain-containing protein n=1 Tax=Oceaniferula flava TaxID=2800421 RepID=A0AAE2SCU8_9BACT|nr:PEP-CTERM sorting domain-containing protein [Oceaniferula flavus]MBK1853941.1 PEP-CTERM sorting domain-containing protein [Oceaniferula flavus]MBM1135247.1 PEP-CTERM sorting domain-containing protein [Oceaniferula flavus]
MKTHTLLSVSLLSVAISASSQAALLLQYDSGSNPPQNNSGVGHLVTYNVDAAFISSPLSHIGNDGTSVQGVGSVASYPGATPPDATTVNGGTPTQTNTTTVGAQGGLTFSDVTFEINPNGGLTGTTADSLAGGNFIFFTFTAAQAFNLTELSAISDPNNGTGRHGAQTAGAFVSVNGGTFNQFGSDFSLLNNAPRTNVFTDTLFIDAADTVEVRLAFTEEEFSNGFQAATRIGSISVNGDPIPEPSSAALLGLGGLALILRRRK